LLSIEPRLNLARVKQQIRAATPTHATNAELGGVTVNPVRRLPDVLSDFLRVHQSNFAFGKFLTASDHLGKCQTFARSDASLKKAFVRQRAQTPILGELGVHAFTVFASRDEHRSKAVLEKLRRLG
jgi:hypothetical protein